MRPLHSVAVATKVFCATQGLRPRALYAGGLPRVDVPQRVDEALVERLVDYCAEHTSRHR